MALLQALLIGLIASILAPGQLFYFDVTPKIAIVLLGAAALLLWPLGETSGAPRAFTFPAVAYFVSLAGSAAFSSNAWLSTFGGNWRRFGAVTQAAVLIFAWMLARHVAGRPDRARIVLRGVAASGVLTAVYGIAQYFGWDPFLPAAGYHIGEGIWTIVRPPGTLGHAAYFATWLLAVIFLSLMLAEWETALWLRRAARLCAAVAAVAMLFTGTRAAMFGLAVGVAVWLWRRGPRISRRILVTAALLVAAAIAFYYSPPGWQLRSRARWFAEDPWGGARLNLWRDTAAMAVHRLPLGYGPEVFTAAFPRFESKTLARAYPDFLHESPHNMFLDALITQGLPGLVILCAFCWFGLRAAWRSKHPGAAWLLGGLAASIASQQFTVFIMPTALAFYVMVALAIGLEGSGVPARRVWAPLALPLAYVAIRLLLSDHQLEGARQALLRGDISSATAHYQSYSELRLPGSASDLWYSRACASLAAATPNPVVRLQAISQAGAAGLRATATAEDPFNAWYSLSALYAGRNDFAGVEKSLRSAIAARPNWFKPHWALARVLALEGRMDEAREQARTALDLNAGKDPEVASTLQELLGPQPW